MQLHNSTNQSRLCPSLGRNVEPFEVVDVPDKFELCDGCQCKLYGDEPKPAKAK